MEHRHYLSGCFWPISSTSFVINTHSSSESSFTQWKAYQLSFLRLFPSYRIVLLAFYLMSASVYSVAALLAFLWYASSIPMMRSAFNLVTYKIWFLYILYLLYLYICYLKCTCVILYSLFLYLNNMTHSSVKNCQYFFLLEIIISTNSEANVSENIV